MTARKVLIYYAWSHPEEISAPLEVLESRFPALFEVRRTAYPQFAELADPARFDQGVGGFLDHIMKRNFTSFVELVDSLTGQPARQVERVGPDGTVVNLDAVRLADVDTVVVISFDSFRTHQDADDTEIASVRDFLARPDHLVFLCPHHDIGGDSELDQRARRERQLGEFLHHGDRMIPAQQQFGGFARTLLAGLGVPVENRFGLRPAAQEDGAPALIEVVPGVDRLHLLDGVETFNLHPHLPHFARLGAAEDRVDVLARQKIALTAPPHPVAGARVSFDALLQSRADVFAGTLLVGDATLWSSTAGGVDSLRRLWTNLLQRPHRSGAP